MKARKPMRWLVHHAAIEFGIHRQTLTAYLRQSNAEPDKAGKYSTLQIHRAIAGDLQAERVRSERAKADLMELEYEQKMKRLLNSDILFMALADWAQVIVQAVSQSTMPHSEKEELLAHIRKTDVTEIARRATEAGGVAREPDPDVQDSQAAAPVKVGRGKKVAQRGDKRKGREVQVDQLPLATGTNGRGQ